MFFFKSLVFSVFSPSFYAEAVSKGTKRAFGNFILFIFIISALSAVYFIVTFGYKLNNLPEKFDVVPTISIENGLLTTDPARPYEFAQDTNYFAIDTTGSITEIPAGYTDGVLLMRDTVIMRSSERPDDMTASYTEILSETGYESFNLNREDVARVLQTIGVVVLIFSPLAILIGNFLSKFFAIILISILGMIVLSASNVPDAFSKSIRISYYAIIPVVYIGFIGGGLQKFMTFFGINYSLGQFCCLIPLFFGLVKWGIFWGIGAYGVIQAQKLLSSSASPDTAEMEAHG